MWFYKKFFFEILYLQPYDLAEFNGTDFSPPFITKDGPHPLISGTKVAADVVDNIYCYFFPDSLFSLIIFIYVSVTFLYIFYAFCWRTEVHKPMPDNRVRTSFDFLIASKASNFRTCL